jgi:hypothetical protein
MPRRGVIKVFVARSIKLACLPKHLNLILVQDLLLGGECVVCLQDFVTVLFPHILSGIDL